MDFQSLHEIAPDEMMVNDDLDVQLIWLNVLLEKGWELTSDDLMEAFIAHYPYGPNEYGYGKRNYRRGIKPPLSGTYANEFFMHSMGCPIRAEIWASLFPFYPEKAVEYSYMDGCIDHGAEDVYKRQLLYTKTISAIYRTHLDQRISFLHEPAEARFSLSLDISEVFKPVIVYRTIFELVNNRR